MSAPRLPVEVWQLAERYGPPRGLPTALVAAVIAAESGGVSTAVSGAGARGLMGLMPATAQALGVDPNVPEQNVEGGTRYLAEQVGKFGIDLGLAAYNAGPGAVLEAGGIPDNGETPIYVPRVIGFWQDYEAAGQTNAAPDPVEVRAQLDAVDPRTRSAIGLAVAAFFVMVVLE